MPTFVLAWTTNAKVFGANVGGAIALPLIKNRIEAFSLDSAPNLEVSDTYVQPISLGWHLPRADVTAGYGVYLRTGDFYVGGHENSGLGMFSHEVSIGSTVYLDKTRQWHAAANLAYEMHANKPGTDIDVGDLVTIEGGVGRTFIRPLAGEPIPLIANLGVAYYSQFKATQDSGADIQPALRGLKDRVFAIGPEFNVYIPSARATLGVRYLPELGAQNTTQGQTIFVSTPSTSRATVQPAGNIGPRSNIAPSVSALNSERETRARASGSDTRRRRCPERWTLSHTPARSRSSRARGPSCWRAARSTPPRSTIRTRTPRRR